MQQRLCVCARVFVCVCVCVCVCVYIMTIPNWFLRAVELLQHSLYISIDSHVGTIHCKRTPIKGITDTMNVCYKNNEIRAPYNKTTSQLRPLGQVPNFILLKRQPSSLGHLLLVCKVS